VAAVRKQPSLQRDPSLEAAKNRPKNIFERRPSQEMAMKNPIMFQDDLVCGTCVLQWNMCVHAGASTTKSTTITARQRTDSAASLRARRVGHEQLMPTTAFPHRHKQQQSRRRR
jgi:hypothetical protein